MGLLRTSKLLLAVLLFLESYSGYSQLVVVENNNAQALAQRLVGDGVIISNATLTSSFNAVPTGFFNNQGNTNIGIDSGIVLTSGRSKSDFNISRFGVDGNGTFPANLRRADNVLGLPGDADLASQLGVPVNNLFDAIALEFDFIPLGDTIRFNYIMSSEEYTAATVCVFNDAFAFFITGPGIPGGRQNIALIPGTTTPVSISNVNDIRTAGCVNNPQFYVDNTTNFFFVHEGHTRVFTAVSQVIPCETYHLKLVISDVGDPLWDSGVFLEAKSLTSNAISLNNLTQTDNTGNSYLVEGCAIGSFRIKRPRADAIPLSVNLSYAGTAQNTVDVQTLPTTITIPANDTDVIINVIPIIDNLPEGIETIKVYALAGCANGTPTDSTIIQIRDYDTLGVAPDLLTICRQSPVQLAASPGYSIYRWNANPTLSNINIRNPVANPVAAQTVYTCTATEGTCNARDSAIINLKALEFVSKTNVNCRGASTGVINVSGGWEWQQPVEFSIDGINWQPDSSFSNLPVGNYIIRIRDANCRDSIPISIIQAFPDLTVSNTAVTPAGCSGNPDGSVTIAGNGGNGLYSYSVDGINFQSSNLFNLVTGNYTATIKDNNGCTAVQDFLVPLNNTVSIDAGIDTAICESTSYQMNAISNATSFIWTPAGTLSGANTMNPMATPTATTMYYVNAVLGICNRTDSIQIAMRPAPLPDAGSDTNICIGKSVQLSGSGGINFQWSPSTYMQTGTTISNPVVRPPVSVTYSLMVRDNFNCLSLQPDFVTVNVTPAVKIFAGRDTVAAIGQPVQLNVVERSNAGVVSYSWSLPQFLDNPLSQSPVATLPQDFTYTVTGTTADGCQGADDITIKVYKGPEIYVPTGFTPNGDGLNDLLRPVAVGIKEFKYFRVFNRWGELIFSSGNPATGWDGRIKGAEQATGTFLWMAEAIDFRGQLMVRKGSVTIIR